MITAARRTDCVYYHHSTLDQENKTDGFYQRNIGEAFRDQHLIFTRYGALSLDVTKTLITRDVLKTANFGSDTTFFSVFKGNSCLVKRVIPSWSNNNIFLTTDDTSDDRGSAILRSSKSLELKKLKIKVNQYSDKQIAVHYELPNSFLEKPLENLSETYVIKELLTSEVFQRDARLLNYWNLLGGVNTDYMDYNSSIEEAERIVREQRRKFMIEQTAEKSKTDEKWGIF